MYLIFIVSDTDTNAIYKYGLAKYFYKLVFRQCAASIRGISRLAACLAGCLVQLAKLLSPNLISVTARLAWPQLPYSTYVQTLVA